MSDVDIFWFNEAKKAYAEVTRLKEELRLEREARIKLELEVPSRLMNPGAGSGAERPACEHAS